MLSIIALADKHESDEALGKQIREFITESNFENPNQLALDLNGSEDSDT